MYYIVFDVEFNQDLPSLQISAENIRQSPYEIIQIGAVKLDQNLNNIATFNRYIKPSIYSQISTFVTELTGITTDQLKSEKPFTDVLYEFIQFIGEENAVFCTWGMSDMKELFRNIEFHSINKNKIPAIYINLQPHTSLYLHLPQEKLLNLQAAVETLEILKPYPFHNALNDAYYTAEILKIIHNPAIQPKRYDPSYVNIRPRQRKKVIDHDKLLHQFEKMYDRHLTKEEQDMVILAYKMGKTNQFLKEV